MMDFLAGKKTHLLVALALILNAFGYVDTPAGIELAKIDTHLIVQELLIASISTVKLGIERALKR